MSYHITTKLTIAAIGIAVIGLVSGIQAAVPEGCKKLCAAKTCQMSCQQCCNQKWSKPEHAQKKSVCMGKCQRANKH